MSRYNPVIFRDWYMIRPLVLLLVCLFALPCTASAESLRIATIELPPFGFSEDGVHKGLCFELGDVIAREAGFEPDNRLRPVARAVEDVAQGTADLIIMLRSEAIEKWADNVGQALDIHIVAMGRRRTRLVSEVDLRGKLVAFVRGAGYHDEAVRRLGIIPYPASDYEQTLKMLVSRRVDLAMGTWRGLRYTSRLMGLPDRMFDAPLVLSTVHGCVYLSKRVEGEARERLIGAVKKVLGDGTVERLADKYAL